MKLQSTSKDIYYKTKADFNHQLQVNSSLLISKSQNILICEFLVKLDLFLVFKGLG